ncbi:thioredoxin family protein [Horticoccus luteus]|uniref:Thioredoxin family protein n=1 Tax=Horticoccus luteus TaxID=2862869 RepID=A0A8F9TWM6_9BACT|nr:protein-disulfide reductase DsbD domain-containing protein [Horticoccus luteus]QYM79174.1 thioredoxin family protein [Horticoccus luteus]
MRLLRSLVILLCGLTTALATRAESHVQASLVAADTGIQPGHTFTVALRLVHEPHWHTYWLNPGTGLATTIDWKLPEGFHASAIQWPAPIVIKDHTGTVTGNGYDGDTLLPVEITAPADLAPGTTVQLKATVDWLMCSDVCIPGSGDISLTLPVTAAAPAPDATWGEKIRGVVADLPRPLPAWHFDAQRTGDTITLHVTGDAAADHTPRGLHFFADDNLIAYEQPQNVVSSGAHIFTLTLPVSPDGPANATELHGVLTSETGWLADGSLRGLRVDTPLAHDGAARNTAAPADHGSEAGTSTFASPSSTGSLGGTLLLAFLGGLILNLMPCVFPVLGLKILGFVNQAGHARSRVITHGLVFTAGVLLSFWTLAGVLAVLRAGGAKLGWGFQLQSPAFVFGLAVLLLVFALNMSGVFEFGLRATAVGSGLQTKSGLTGSFFTGVLATIVATPCSAPFLAPALGAALALSTAASFAIFTAIALGLSTPYLLLSIFPSAIKILPRPGAWMETFKQFMAFPLYATVGYLVWVLAGQTSDDGLQNVLFGLVLVALGVWFYGRWHAPGTSTGRARFGSGALIVCAALGLWLGWPAPVAAGPAGTVVQNGLTWQPWSPEAVAKLRAENRIIYVDFTARWCATCQTNKRIVFHNDEVLQTFAAKNIATLRGDWTNQDPRITAELAKYHRSAVPFNVVWLPGRTEPVILPELLTPSTVLDAVRQN